MSDDAKDAETEDPKSEEPESEEETSENAADEDGSEEDGEEGDDKPKGKLAGKMKYIIIGAVVLLLGGGGAGLYFSGLLSSDKLHETTIMLPGEPVFYELPRMTVDLKPSDKRARPFIRLLMQVELQGETAKTAFVDNETKIMDAMQSHLRSVTSEELSGVEGTERLREDFTIIINRIIDPERAITIYYKEILVR